MAAETKETLNFIEHIIEDDIKNGVHDGRVHTRFPPEPNGYLHIGHAKSICLNFGLANKFNGKTNLRFDDTNPTAEETEFVDGIKADVKWLGFDWGEKVYFTSDYFGQLYDFAVKLIKDGKAYVDDSTKEEISQMRMSPTEPGIESPFRNRSAEENLELFEQMKNGECVEGSKVLRAKIDMTSPNMHLRDPILYRILFAHHHRTGKEWCIYPMYDWAHGQSDSIEQITHSVCTLEFKSHAPLYDWFIENLGIYKSTQYEFARLNLSYTVMSKRRLKQLVEEGIVNGWDDPRMPTISAMRRRGYTPASIREFSKRVGVAKRENVIDFSLLEWAVRDDLNKICNRVMAVTDPLKIVITNYPDEVEEMEITNNPEDESAGSRKVPFSKELYIEKTDFMEDPPRKFFRLGLERNVRLKGAYIIRCDKIIKDDAGEVVELHCHYYPDSRSGSDSSGVKAKGTLHWVSIPHASKAEVRIYDRLFNDEAPNGHKDRDFKEFLNKESLRTETAFIEPYLKTAQSGDRFQFMRKGYFCVDPDSSDGNLVFNRTVTLKDGWAKKGK